MNCGVFCSLAENVVFVEGGKLSIEHGGKLSKQERGATLVTFESSHHCTTPK